MSELLGDSSVEDASSRLDAYIRNFESRHGDVPVDAPKEQEHQTSTRPGVRGTAWQSVGLRIGAPDADIGYPTSEAGFARSASEVTVVDAAAQRALGTATVDENRDFAQVRRQSASSSQGDDAHSQDSNINGFRSAVAGTLGPLLGSSGQAVQRLQLQQDFPSWREPIAVETASSVSATQDSHNTSLDGSGVWPDSFKRKSASSAVAAALAEYRSGLSLGAVQRPAPMWLTAAERAQPMTNVSTDPTHKMHHSKRQDRSNSVPKAGPQTRQNRHESFGRSRYKNRPRQVEPESYSVASSSFQSGSDSGGSSSSTSSPAAPPSSGQQQQHSVPEVKPQELQHQVQLQSRGPTMLPLRPDFTVLTEPWTTGVAHLEAAIKGPAIVSQGNMELSEILPAVKVPQRLSAAAWPDVSNLADDSALWIQARGIENTQPNSVVPPMAGYLQEASKRDSSPCLVRQTGNQGQNQVKQLVAPCLNPSSSHRPGPMRSGTPSAWEPSGATTLTPENGFSSFTSTGGSHRSQPSAPAVCHTVKQYESEMLRPPALGSAGTPAETTSPSSLRAPSPAAPVRGERQVFLEPLHAPRRHLQRQGSEDGRAGASAAMAAASAASSAAAAAAGRFCESQTSAPRFDGPEAACGPPLLGAATNRVEALLVPRASAATLTANSQSQGMEKTPPVQIRLPEPGGQLPALIRSEASPKQSECAVQTDRNSTEANALSVAQKQELVATSAPVAGPVTMSVAAVQTESTPAAEDQCNRVVFPRSGDHGQYFQQSEAATDPASHDQSNDFGALAEPSAFPFHKGAGPLPKAGWTCDAETVKQCAARAPSPPTPSTRPARSCSWSSPLASVHCWQADDSLGADDIVTYGEPSPEATAVKGQAGLLNDAEEAEMLNDQLQSTLARGFRHLRQLRLLAVP
eukprot:TRINITY_DN4947_c1_g1_i1.p1 TRINITY_DN4947_c1_g1~~TRINITY_DN4947_c1_g1_i1.p1  ORF type:complete len:939 (+),score=164.84 TRINITY_DN4947_c1_g1_i1:78-2819(+)